MTYWTFSNLNIVLTPIWQLQKSNILFYFESTFVRFSYQKERVHGSETIARWSSKRSRKNKAVRSTKQGCAQLFEKAGQCDQPNRSSCPEIIQKQTLARLANICKDLANYLITSTEPVTYSKPSQPRIYVRVFCTCPLLVSWTHLQSFFEFVHY